MEFKFEGIIIEIDDGKKTFCHMQQEWEKQLKQIKEKYQKNYRSLKNLANLTDDELFWNLINETRVDGYMAVDYMINSFGKIGIKPEPFFDACGDDSDIFDSIQDSLFDQYIALLEDKEKKRQYRQARKDNRRKWYGLTVEAQRKADIKNAQSAMLHSARNAVGNAMTASAINSEMNSIYGKYEEIIWKELEKVILSYKDMSYVLMKSSNTPFRMITQSDIQSSDEALAEAKKTEINSVENLNAIKTALEYDPENRSVYEFMIQNYGDRDNDVEFLARDFFIELRSWKEDKAGENIKRDQVSDLSSEEKVLAAIAVAEGHCKFFGVSTEKYKYIAELRNTWEALDKKLRTVEGIGYATREEADTIKEDLKYLQDFAIRKSLLSQEANISEIKQNLMKELKTDVVKNSLDMRLEKIKEYQDLKNIQKASKEIWSSVVLFGKIQKSFFWGYIFAQNSKFERFRDVLSNNKKIAFVYDPGVINKGKNGLLLTNTDLYYYDQNNILEIALTEYQGITIDSDKIVIHRNNESDIVTTLKVKLDQIEYGSFCDIFNRVVFMCMAIKNGHELLSDQEVYSNYVSNEKMEVAKKKKIGIIAAGIILLISIIAVVVVSGEKPADVSEREEVDVQQFADEQDPVVAYEGDSSITEEMSDQNDNMTVNQFEEETEIEEENIVNAFDFSSWEGTYQRATGPSVYLSIDSGDETGIVFSAGVGYSGYLAYVDMREYKADRQEDGTAIYCEGDYVLTFSVDEEGIVVLEENQDSPYGINLAGIYPREENVIYPECEFIFPESDIVELTEMDYEGLTALECKIAKNEIYARRGRKFKDESLNNYFDSCSWYEGYIEPEDFTEDMLNEIERTNIDLIVEYENMMGFRE